MVTVLSHGGGGKAINIFCFNRFQNFLKGECRYMMAFIYDDHSIVCDEGLDILFFSLEERLHNGDINDPTVSIFSRSDLPDETTLLFLPRFLGSSGKTSWMFKNCSRDDFHCSSRALDCTKIRVLTLRCPIKYAPITVLPKAVVADRTPESSTSSACAAGSCSGA